LLRIAGVVGEISGSLGFARWPFICLQRGFLIGVGEVSGSLGFARWPFICLQRGSWIGVGEVSGSLGFARWPFICLQRGFLIGVGEVVTEKFVGLDLQSLRHSKRPKYSQSNT
jgi:hypothetical protein